MNPYEKTAQEMKRQSEGPKRFAKTAAVVAPAIASASFAPVLARAAPFLSQYIPEDLAIKGLSKISPRLGAFVQSAVDSGYDFSQVKDFIGKQVTESQAPQAAKENRNIIEQESPELHSFILEQIKNGRKPIEAGALAFQNQKFMKAINKLKNTHKANWADLIQTVYGTGETAQPQTQQSNAMREEAMNPPGSMPATSPSAEQQAFTQPQPPQPMQAQGGGQGAQALQAILQKINQRLGG
ncbi:hypothetical protein UFOVP264_18 [uncultured Caudovirales phage]|uniref:Uncharacterized protein n=1 Tax=uncultured Caudovirales phage TaxID=2100421 RepID=A0A6J5LLE5_9CAUD|nr:hypothetical protein UFOVP264_18 [uncultured Caudovirales phage]